jgi:hypothetical protein
MATRPAFLWLIISATLAGPGSAQSPLSAIDWLSNTVRAPAVHTPDIPGGLGETATTDSAAVEAVTVMTIDGPSPDAVGILPASVTGLPHGFWGTSNTPELVRLIRTQPAQNLPALQDLLQMLLLAEVDPPLDADGTGTLFLARVDKLLEMGALDQAQALLEQAGAGTPEMFRRLFDTALLTGTEDRPCETLVNNTDIAPTYPARIFCLARNGSWSTANLTLETSKALGYIDDHEEALLARFLNPGLFEGEPRLGIPDHVTPLVFRIHEAIGEPVPTAPLARAFANADLRNTAGWKSQIEAAERLVVTGAIDANRLLGLYTERKPAASGGVWERARAVQAFDLAYENRDGDEIAATLPNAREAMQDRNLEVAFASLYGAGLAGMALPDRIAPAAFETALLSEEYEAVANTYSPQTPREHFLSGLAKGDLTGIAAPDPVARSIKRAFSPETRQTLFPPVAALLENGQLGEAILRTLALFSTGAQGNPEDLTRALILLRRMGLEDTARRAALQLVLLGPRNGQ